jgi:hypothetical protein
MKTEYAIGKTRTGDQLHICSGRVTHDNGRQYISDNAHCNQHNHLRLVGNVRSAEKVSIKMRPGLFCRKCFGTDEARIIAREYLNATVTA